MANTRKQPGKQQGVVLITGLIFMVILTLLAVGAMRMTTLEEKMAGNTRNRDLAFQAAEAGIRLAETFLATSNAGAGLPAFDGSVPGYYGQNLVTGNSDTFWTNYNWGAGSVLTANGLKNVAQQPRYVIEKLNLPVPGGTTEYDPGNPESSIYRVTARGVGGDADTAVILQSNFFK